MATATTRTRREQATFDFPNGWGGRREGAGPKPKGDRPGVSHRTRAPLASRFPVHVCMKVKRGLPSLRHRSEYEALVACFAAVNERESFRLVHHSVQRDHLHLVCEARDRRELSRGIHSLAIRVAKRLNRLWSRTGTVWADRYHDRILRSPREVRNALAYVLLNGRKHGVFARRDRPDPFSSGRWFDGWKDWRGEAPGLGPTLCAKTWLLTVGWRRHGLIRLDEVPGG